MRGCKELRTVLLVVFLTVLFPAIVFSKNLSEEIIEIEKANAQWDTLAAEFKQETFVKLLGKSIAKKGKIYLKKKGKLRIEYTPPSPKAYLSDGTTIWVLTPGDENSLQTYAVNDQNLPREALPFLSGFGKMREEFHVGKSGTFPKAKEGCVALHLTPKSRKAHFKSLDVLFDDRHLLNETIINNLSGNTSHYTFTKIKTNINLDDEIFTFSSGKATPDTLPE